MESFADLFGEWRTANKRACDSEAALVERCNQAMHGWGRLPEPDEWQRAKSLRTFATYLMDAAMAKLQEERARRGADPPPDKHKPPLKPSPPPHRHGKRSDG